MQLTPPTEPHVFRIHRESSGTGVYPKVRRRRTAGSLLVLLVSGLASLALSGCAFLKPHADPTRFYVVSAASAHPERAAQGEFERWKVGFRRVEVPAYLRGQAIVVRTSTNEVQYSDFDCWAEPLDQGISRVLRETLSPSPNVQSVAMNSHGDDSLDYEVAVRVSACEGVRVINGNNSIRFVATWDVQSLAKLAPAGKHGVFSADSVAWDGKSYGQLAERLSEAISSVGKAIAADLPMEARTSVITTKKSTP